MIQSINKNRFLDATKKLMSVLLASILVISMCPICERAEARPDSSEDSEATTTNEDMLQDVTVVEDFAKSQVETNLTESDEHKQVEDNNKATQNSSSTTATQNDSSTNESGSNQSSNSTSSTTADSTDQQNKSDDTTQDNNTEASDNKFIDMTGDYSAAKESLSDAKLSKINPLSEITSDGSVSNKILNPMNELAFIQSAEGSSQNIVFDTYINKQRKYQGNTLTNAPFANTDISDGDSETFEGKQVSKYKSNFTSGDEYDSDVAYSNIRAVAFRPDKKHTRKDCVVYIGLVPTGDDEADFITWMYDYTNKKRSANLKLGSLHWQNIKSQTYSSEFLNFMAITAGNYSNKGYDTAIVYFPGHGADVTDDLGLLEIDWEDMANPKVSKVSDSAIHPDYKTARGGGWPRSTIVYDKLTCSLDTGDVNGDGIDDLAVVTSVCQPKNMDGSMACRFMPYLSICYGQSGSDLGSVLNKTSGDYVNDGGDGHHYWATIRNPGISLGDADGDGVDEVTVAGTKWFVKTSADTKDLRSATDGGESWDGYRLNTYCLGTYRATESKLTTIEFRNDLKANDWKEAGTYHDDKIQARCGVKYFKVNGNNKPEALYIDGNVYRMSENLGKVDTSWVYTPQYFQSSDKQTTKDFLITNTYTRSVVAGNFDKNTNGREQLMILLGYKRDGMHEDAISAMSIGGEYDQDVKDNDGKVKEYKDATGFYYNDMKNHDTYTCNKTNSNVEDKFSSELVSIDIGTDGVEISYSDVDLSYTEPEVQAVIQAAPSFGELGQANGVTAYSTTVSYNTITDSKEWNHTWGVGFAGTISTDNFYGSLRVGWAGNWSSGWTKSRQTTFSQTFEATKVTNVVVRRIPTYVYKYKVLNAKDDNNEMACIVPGSPYYVQYSIDDYNEFVDVYNSSLEKRKAAEDLSNVVQLEKITEESLLNNSGHPWSYASQLGGTNISNDSWVHVDRAKNTGNATFGTQPTWFTLSRSAGSQVVNLTTGEALEHHWQTMNGWSSDISLQIGVKVAKGGVYFTQSQTYGWKGGDTKGENSGNSGRVYNIDKTSLLSSNQNSSATIDAYKFTWAFAGGNIQVGKKGNGDNVNVPLLHYILKNVSSPPAPVIMKEASYQRQSDGSTQVTLKWTLPKDDNSGRRYFANSDLQYTVYERDGRTMSDWKKVSDKPFTVDKDENGLISYTFTANSDTSQTGCMTSYAVRCSLRSGKQARVESINPTPIILLYTASDTSSAKTSTSTGSTSTTTAQGTTKSDVGSETQGTQTQDGSSQSSTDSSSETKDSSTDTSSDSSSSTTQGEKGEKGDTGAQGEKGEKGDKGDTGADGKDGLNAYQLALKNGFKGTLSEWLKSLKGQSGKSAYQFAREHGFTGTEIEWINSLRGIDANSGKSPYEVVKEAGYKGTIEDWFSETFGENGTAAFNLAKENGFSGNLQQWLDQQKGKSAYDLYRESCVAAKLLSEEKFISLVRDKQQNTSGTGSYSAYVEALKETDATITPLSKDDFFKQCINYGGAYASYFSLANTFLREATNKMTDAEIQAIYGQVMILSEDEYNAAIKGCTSTEDYAKKDIELINNVMSQVYASNDSFNWANINYENIKYRALEVFEATCGYSSGYAVYTNTASDIDNNKSILTEEAWLESLRTTSDSSVETVINSIFKVLVNKGYSGSLDDFINAMKQKNGTVDDCGYAGANVQQNTDQAGNTSQPNTSADLSSSTSNTSLSTNSSSSGSSGTSGQSATSSTAQLTTGKEGRGITSAAINDAGDLILTYSDNTTQDVGLVRATVAASQVSNPLDAFVFTALGLAIASLVINAVLASFVYRMSRRNRS